MLPEQYIMYQDLVATATYLYSGSAQT
ncbi:hypothetical protein A2U01_0093758, partial [Trifolium medium]|nr:hypothetical protein [Trifolium medium]